MKQIVLIIGVVALFFSCNQAPKYVITGTIADSTQTIIYLQQRIEGQTVTVDSAQLIEGKFSMTGTVDVAEEYYLTKGERDKLVFFLENEKISIVSDTTTVEDAKVKGGAVQELYNEYLEKYNRLYEYMLSEYYKIREEKDPEVQKVMEAQVDSLYEDVELYQKTFLLEHTSSPVAPYILTRIQYGMSGDELDEVLSQIDTSLSNTASYKFLAKRVEALKKVAVGATAPDFTQNDADGNPITFSSIYSANKLTLVDFWASWCGPCRAENPNVVKAYNEYNAKGFTVFGVSLDNNKERWLKAIEDDGLTWQHVSDLQGWGNAAAKEYSVNSIPANFLIDSDGKIVAANLRGEDLLNKLNELLN